MAGQNIAPGAPAQVLLPFGSSPNRQVVIEGTDFTGIVPITVALTPESGDRIEYSANLEDELDLDGLMLKLRDCAVASGVLPLGGIRVRGARRDRFLVSDGDPQNGFVHVTARIGHGRPAAVRQKVAASLFDVLSEHVGPIFDRRGLGISFEIQEIEPATSLKKNNLHARLSEGA